jgi:hypothetical protein
LLNWYRDTNRNFLDRRMFPEYETSPWEWYLLEAVLKE